jgi:hypothetical protein
MASLSYKENKVLWMRSMDINTFRIGNVREWTEQVVISGQYYKNITIVNDDDKVISKIWYNDLVTICFAS